MSDLVSQMPELREAVCLQRLHKQLDGLHPGRTRGYEPFSKARAELLFDVVSRDYKRTSLTVTTNLLFENWTEVLPATLTSAGKRDGAAFVRAAEIKAVSKSVSKPLAL